MRNAMPLQWIEQAEARQVLAIAAFERTPRAPWCRTAGDAAMQWLPRLGAWLAARHPMGLAVPQVQPVLIRQPRCPESGSHDEGGYCCNW